MMVSWLESFYLEVSEFLDHGFTQILQLLLGSMQNPIIDSCMVCYAGARSE